ncbi:MAG: DUF11 domain-containing protein [Acidobacteriota bacterium]|nr:MAG: DUF11 domain-containing protein [Acidobacteriota bacterium]
MIRKVFAVVVVVVLSCVGLLFGQSGNSAPEFLVPVSSFTVREGDIARFSGTASDPDGDPFKLDFAVVSGAGVSLDLTSQDGNGSLFFVNSFRVPQGSSGKTIVVQVSASDGSNAPVSTTFSFTVTGTNHPPTVTAVLADSKGDSPSNPLVSPTSISFAVSTNDPDGHGSYAYSWGFRVQSGIFCSGEFPHIFGASAETGWIQIGRMSTDAVIEVNVVVTDETHVARDSFLAYVAAAPGGCSSSVGGGSGESPGLTGIDLTTSLISNTATPGQSFTAKMTATSPEAITFTLRASTTNNKATAPVILKTTRSACQSGCTVEQRLTAPISGSRYYLWLDAEDSGSSAGDALTVFVEAQGGSGGSGGGTTPSCSESPSWASSTCGTKVYAGCGGSVVGGQDIELVGQIDNPIFGTCVTCPARFEWTIINSGGITGLVLENGKTARSTLSTPKVTEAKTVTLQFTGSANNCSASDQVMIQVVPDEQTVTEADLKVTGPASAIVGRIDQTVNYTIVVKNHGPATATGVNYSQPLPAGLEFISGSFGSISCGVVASSVQCDLGTLTNGKSLLGSMTFKANEEGAPTVVASVSGNEDDPVASNDSATLKLQIEGEPGVDLEVSGPAETQISETGAELAYSVRVTNNGPDKASSVVLNHPIPSYLKFVAGQFGIAQPCSDMGDRAECNLGTLTKGQSRHVNFTFEASQGTTDSVALSVTAAETELKEENNSFSISYEIEDASGIDLALSGPANIPEVTVGDEISYKVSVANHGPEDASGVRLRHPVPGNMKLISALADSANCSQTGSEVSCVLGKIAAGTSQEVAFSFEATDAGSPSVTVSVEGTPEDKDSSNNSLTIAHKVAAVSDLEVSGQSDSVRMTKEEPYSYEISIKNNGPSAASNVLVVVTFSNELLIDQAGPNSAQCAVDSGQMSCELGSRGVDETNGFAVMLTAPTTGEFSAEIHVSADEQDPDLSNNTSHATLIATEAATLLFPHSVLGREPFPKNPFVGIAVYNPGSEPTDVEFLALDEFGDVLDRIRLSELENRLLPPNGQIARTARDITDRTGVKTLSARGVDSPVEGFFLLGDITLSSLDGVAGNFVEAEDLVFPIAKESATESTQLVLYNPSVQEGVSVVLRLYDSSGRALDAATTALPPMGSLGTSIPDLFGISNVGGYIVASAQNPIRGLAVYSNGSEIMALPAQAYQSVKRLIVPHFFSLNEDTTKLTLLNTGAEPVLTFVKAYSDEGQFLDGAVIELEAGGMKERAVQNLLHLPAEVITGYLIIDFDATGSSQGASDGVAVQGFVTFTTGGAKTLAALPLRESGDSDSKFLHVAQSQEFRLFTGLAILNPGGTATDVTVRVFDEDGQLTAERTITDLGGGHRVLKLLAEFLEEPGFEAVGGHFEVVSESPVVVFALFGDAHQRYLAAIEGQVR